DNRLQPQGWSSAGPHAAETGPIGTCIHGPGKQTCDPNYQDGSGSKKGRYLVPLDRPTRQGAPKRATLYFQSIPPYYQLQRATDAAGLDTDRLLRFVTNLNVNGTPIDNWVLEIASDRSEIQTARGGTESSVFEGNP